MVGAVQTAQVPVREVRAEKGEEMDLSTTATGTTATKGGSMLARVCRRLLWRNPGIWPPNQRAAGSSVLTEERARRRVGSTRVWVRAELRLVAQRSRTGITERQLN